MKQIEITKKLNIPSSTLKDWSNINHPRHDLFQLLTKLSSDEIKDIQTRPDYIKKSRTHNYHRLLHIINRNTNTNFTLNDIVHAFNATACTQKSDEEKLIIERFFKECDKDDYKKLIAIKGIEKDNLKSIYKDSIAARSLYRGQWDKIFNITSTNEERSYTGDVIYIPKGISIIEKLRANNAH
ncbi:MAG: hypothetical protein COA44_02255 [Arcobacter sp.]|nr:MAG: hypothetical protein COA44_02255 [Arcobacter sp.]